MSALRAREEATTVLGYGEPMLRRYRVVHRQPGWTDTIGGQK